jgi:predicted RNase H-like HicB family nuclease
MKHKILNYLIVIEPDTRTGTSEACYSVYCPSLGLADSGDTVEEAVANMEKLISFHIESLKEKEGKFALRDHAIDSFIATAKVKIPV